jgi:hypothetical protein
MNNFKSRCGWVVAWHLKVTGPLPVLQILNSYVFNLRWRYSSNGIGAWLHALLRGHYPMPQAFLRCFSRSFHCLVRCRLGSQRSVLIIEKVQVNVPPTRWQSQAAQEPRERERGYRVDACNKQRTGPSGTPILPKSSFVIPKALRCMRFQPHFYAIGHSPRDPCRKRSHWSLSLLFASVVRRELKLWKPLQVDKCRRRPRSSRYCCAILPLDLPFSPRDRSFD